MANRSGAAKFYPMAVGLTTLAILVQSVFAGVFLQGDNRDVHHDWITAHKVGGNVTVVLGVVTAVLAFVAFRQRRDLLVGSVLLAVALIVELVLGMLITGSSSQQPHDSLTIIHVPLALLIFGAAIFLSVTSAGGRRAD